MVSNSFSILLFNFFLNSYSYSKHIICLAREANSENTNMWKQLSQSNYNEKND